MAKLTYDRDFFYVDGKPTRILSGAMHYFRTVPEYWEDRLTKLKAMGLNTVETYMCWNLHERREGCFDFSGILDVARFVSIAEKLGLYVIVRPGPYICAEWDFGGFPGWLHKYPEMRLRCNDPLFMAKLTPYLTKVVEQLMPHFSSNGGSILMMQVENEYGSYGSDKVYLSAIRDVYRSLGVTSELFTSDGPCWSMFGGGSLDGLLEVANFGSGANGAFRLLKEFRPDQPVMCGEFWNGWFDHWYEGHHTRDAADAAAAYAEVLDSDGTAALIPEGKNGHDVPGGSCNLYMFHGGTIFGFTNGANHGGKYEPTISSYDYDSPLTEAGDITAKYYAFRKVIEDRFGKAPAVKVENTAKAAYGTVVFDKFAPLYDNFKAMAAPAYLGREWTKTEAPVKSAYPMWMEELGQDFGYVMYSTVVEGPTDDCQVRLDQLHDRAYIFVDGKFAGIKERGAREDDRRRNDEVKIHLGMGESVRLDILVENNGRVNYGMELGYTDKKGFFAAHVGTIRSGWDIYPLPMENFSAVNWTAAKPASYPAIFGGSLKIEGKPCDTFIDMAGFKKGFITVNGHNLGRYWLTAGPTKTMYVPAPWLREGDNEIILFECDGCDMDAPSVEFKDVPDLG